MENTWKKLREELDEAGYHFTDLFSIVGAAYLSREWPGEPLWIHVMGPPSTGKSFTMTQFRLLTDIKIVSSVTPAALISGYGGETGDRSLLKDMQGKLLMARDFGTILSMGYDRSNEVFGILREAFDGEVKKDFGNCHRLYQTHFNFVAASTFAAEKFSAFKGQLGERFIRYIHYMDLELPPPRVNPALQATVADWFTERDRAIAQEPGLHDDARDMVATLSEIAAKARTEVVHKGGRDEILEVPGFEGPYRLYFQLSKLYRGLLVLTADHNYSMELCRKVASHMLKPRREKILRILLREDEPVKTPDILRELKLGDSVVRKELKALEALGIVEKLEGKPKWPYTIAWEVTERFREKLNLLLMIDFRKI